MSMRESVPLYLPLNSKSKTLELKPGIAKNQEIIFCFCNWHKKYGLHGRVF